MSNRGFLYTNPQTKPHILAESARYVPLFWLSFLSPKDINKPDKDGTFVIDRNRAVERSSNCLPFFSLLFPKVRLFEEGTDLLLELIKSKKSKTIGINVQQLLPEADDEMSSSMPNLTNAVAAIESREANFSLKIPGRTIQNPFTGEESRVAERSFESTADMLLFVCSIDAPALNSKEQDVVRETIIGHVWD